MAWASWSGGTSFSKNPLAPALNALKAYSSRSKVVKMSTWLNAPDAVMTRVASIPSSVGMRTSMSTTSGS
jgi:hypothetical protein